MTGEAIVSKRYLSALLTLTLAYWAAAWLGLQWSVLPGAGSAVWPAAGIGFAGLMIGGLRLWPAIVIGRLLTAFSVGSPQPFWADTMIAFGTMFGALIPALILRRARSFDPTLGRMRDILWLSLVAAVLGATISAGVGVLSLYLAGIGTDRLPAAWLNWWFGFAVGVVTIGPLILTWWPHGSRRWPLRNWIHLAICTASIALVSTIVFLLPQTPFLRVWHVFPLFIWAAVAFQVRGVAAGLVVLSIIAILGTAQGMGPLTFPELSSPDQMLVAQQFIAVTALTKLFLAAAIDERRNVEAQARLAAIVSSSPDAMISATPDGQIASWNQGAEKLFGYTAEEAIGERFDLTVPPGASHANGAVFPRALRGEPVDTEALRVGKDGQERYVSLTASRMMGPDGSVLGVAAVLRDITERKRAEEALRESRDHQRLLINELNHRVKNSLAIVQAIAQQSFKGTHSSPEARASFEGRLAALSKAHDLLTQENWESALMGTVIGDALAPYMGQPGRFLISGPDLRLPPKTAVALALALHELATNAVKYGALSNAEGRVEISWTSDGNVLRLVWREQDGPQVTPPEKRGFGTRLIERSLAAEFEGKVQIEFPPTGVVCTVEAPLPDGNQ